MSQSKNPFEIRLEALKMAKEMLDRQFDVQTEIAYKAYEQADKFGKDTLEAFKEYTPKMFQPEEVVAKAKEFIDFISKKD